MGYKTLRRYATDPVFHDITKKQSESFKHRLEYLWVVCCGYVVFRKYADAEATLLAQAMAHKVATFVMESDAIEYCAAYNKGDNE